MRKVAFALLMALCLAPAAWAKYTGLSLSTPYPDQTVQAGQSAVIPLTVHNYGLDPQVVTLKAPQVAKGWHAAFQGDARNVGAVFVGPDAKRAVSLHLTPPKGVASGTYQFQLQALGKDQQATLPVTLQLAKTIPNWLALSASLPTLKGSSSTNFSYDIKVDNKSGRNVTVSLSADAPQGFEVNFSPQYGSQEVTAIRVKAGENKDISAKVSLPSRVNAGTYHLKVHAAAGNTQAEIPLTMIVSGKPQLSLTTPSGRLSGNAYEGKSTSVALTVKNDGGAPAHDLSFSADSPTHWKVTFSPKRIAQLAPHQKAKVTADITPSTKSLAGDYMVTVNADSGLNSASADYRVTVMTSTMWGVIGIAIAVAAILVIGFAVMRFGRR